MLEANKKILEENMRLVYSALNFYGVEDEDDRASIILALCERMDKFDAERGSFSTFVYQVVRSMRAVIYKYKARQCRSAYVYSLDELVAGDSKEDGKLLYEVIPDPTNGIDDFIAEDDYKTFLYTLNDKRKATLEGVLKGNTYREIAKKENLSAAAIGLRMSDIRKEYEKFMGI